MPSWLIDFALGLAMRFGIPYLADLLKSKLGVGMDNPAINAFCEYQQGQKALKTETKEKVRAAMRPRERDMIGGNR